MRFFQPTRSLIMGTRLTFIISLYCSICSAAEPINLGSKREIFIDNHLIESLEGTELRLSKPRDEGPVHKFDMPWEGPFCGYATVIKDKERYLLYYRGLPRSGKDGTNEETTCVVTSKDGINWQRPNISIYFKEKYPDNNIILANSAPVTHNFSPFLDTKKGIDNDHKFKALGGTERSGLVAFSSADGLIWRRFNKDAVFTNGIFDSQNVSFWSKHEKCYVCYFRTWTGGGYRGYRTVSRTTSKDFISWTDPVKMTFGDTPNEHLYTNQTHPYYRAPHIYLGIAARFMPGRQVLSTEEANSLGVSPTYFNDCSDMVLLSSRGGNTYQRKFMESFVRPGIGLENWVSRSNYPALNIVQTSPTHMSFYANQNYAQPTSNVHRYSLRIDGISSIHAEYDGGEMLTKPFLFEGKQLFMNYSTSAAGGLRVEILNKEGKAYQGLSMNDCIESVGNYIDAQIKWKSNRNLSTLKGKIVRLRIFLKDADLYSLKFK